MSREIKYGRTPLMNAALQAILGEVILQISLGANVNGRDTRRKLLFNKRRSRS
jgi:hypothetical protein